MNKGWLFAIVPGILTVIAVVFVVVLLLIKLLWAWTIPDIFPGAVDDGLIVASLSWFSAFKVAIFVAVLAGIGRGSITHKIH